MTGVALDETSAADRRRWRCNRRGTDQPDGAVYDNANQLKSTTADGPFAHDRNGNRTTGAGLTAVYNAKDQTTRFTRSGLTPVDLSYFGESQEEQANDGLGAQQQSNIGVIRRGSDAYTRTPGGQLTGLRLASGSQRHYAIRDNLGSTVALTDTAGQLSARYRYDAWGAIDTTRSTGLTVANPWRYAGGYEIPRSGLTKFGVRYYDPTQGRWTQPDPLKQIADPRQANAYPYAGDDPVNFVDPSGLCNARFPEATGCGRGGRTNDGKRNLSRNLDTLDKACQVGGGLDGIRYLARKVTTLNPYVAAACGVYGAARLLR